MAGALRGMPIYVPAIADSHCIYPCRLQRDGQAELTPSAPRKTKKHQLNTTGWAFLKTSVSKLTGTD